MALRILLADDEKDFVETLAERLELRGHTVRVVFDGLAALSAVAEETPDVVVLDLLMPGLPGDEGDADAAPLDAEAAADPAIPTGRALVRELYAAAVTPAPVVDPMPADEAAALAAPIRGLAFIPGAQLDEAVILERFGQPAERIRVNDHQEHLLYPAKGLDLVLDSKGRELLQYVAPARFDALRAPLLAQAAGSTPGKP